MAKTAKSKKQKKKQKATQTTIDDERIDRRDLFEITSSIRELDAETMQKAMQEGELPYNETFKEKTKNISKMKEIIKNRNLFDQPILDIIADREKIADAYDVIEKGRKVAALNKHKDKFDQPLDEILQDPQSMKEALNKIDYQNTGRSVASTRKGQDHAVYTVELNGDGDIGRIVELGNGLSSQFVNIPPSEIADIVDTVIEESSITEQAGEARLERLAEFNEGTKNYPSSFAVQVEFDEIDVSGKDMTITPTLNFMNAYDKTSSFTVNPSFTIKQEQADGNSTTTYQAPTDFLLQFANEEEREAISEASKLNGQMSRDKLSVSHRGSKQENAEDREEETAKKIDQALQYFEAVDTIVDAVSSMADRLPKIEVDPKGYERLRDAMVKDGLKPKTQYKRAVKLGQYMAAAGQKARKDITDPEEVKRILNIDDRDFEDEEYQGEFEELVEDNRDNQFLVMEGNGYELLLALGEYLYDQTADSSSQIKKVLKGTFMGGRRGRAARFLERS